MCGLFKRTSQGSRIFFYQLNPCWSLQPEVVGNYLPGTGTLGWSVWYGAVTLHSQDIPPKFLSTTHRRRTSPFHVSAPPTSLDGRGLFNSIVVRLPFNLISDSSEGWLFYSLGGILMWLCEEANHVCQRCHRDPI